MPAVTLVDTAMGTATFVPAAARTLKAEYEVSPGERNVALAGRAMDSASALDTFGWAPQVAPSELVSIPVMVPTGSDPRTKLCVAQPAIDVTAAMPAIDQSAGINLACDFRTRDRMMD